MEFRLNKIDTDLRQKVNDMTKEGKVHSKNGISINKQKNADESEKKNFGEFYKKEQEKKNRSKISVEAVKTETIEVEAEKRTDDDTRNLTGVFLDTRK